MELIATLRSTAAIREFRAEPVADDVVYRVLDTARFAPNGGNAQAWHVVLVKDAGTRRAIRDLYVSGFGRYVTMRAAGVRPWAPLTDRDTEQAAIEQADAALRDGTLAVGDFAEGFDKIPAMLVVLADFRLLAAVDRDLGRYTIVGGASIYPFVWSILLAAREEGLGGVITTMPIHREPELKALLEVPEEFAVAAVLALGYPVHQPTKLRRSAVAQFATIDRFGGDSLDG